MEYNSLKRALTTRDLVIYGVMFMIPIAPFAWYGDLVGPAMGMVSLGYGIALVAMLFTGFSYGTMSYNYPIAGSVYSYVQRSTKPSLGFISGWAIMMDYLILPAVCYLIGAMFMDALVPGIPGIIWFIVFAAIGTTLNALGIDIMSKASWILFGVQMVCIVWFLVGTLVLLSRGEVHVNAVAFYNASDFNMSGVLAATKVTIISYLGFDAISTLAEEAHNPRKSIGRATILSIISIGILFMLLCWFGGIVIPQYTDLPANTPFLAILEVVGGKALVMLTSISLVLSFGIACAMEGQTAITRVLYSMGKDGIMPKVLAKLNRFRVPGIGIIFIGVICVIVAQVCGLTLVAAMLSFGALLGFIALNLSVIWKFWIKNPEKSGKNFFKFVISPLIGFLVCAYILIGGTNTITWIIGGSWMVAGVIWLAVMTKGFRAPTPALNLDAEIDDEESA